MLSNESKTSEKLFTWNSNVKTVNSILYFFLIIKLNPLNYFGYIWLKAILTNSSTLEISGFSLSTLSIFCSALFLLKPRASSADNDSVLIVLSNSNKISDLGSPFATLSFKSIIILWAVFAPIPFTCCIAATSAVVI